MACITLLVKCSVWFVLLALLEITLAKTNLDGYTVPRKIFGDSEKKCYRGLGCFSCDPPFYDPEYRPICNFTEDGVKMKFLLYNRPNINSGYLLRPTRKSIRKSTFNPALKTIVYVHGYLVDSDHVETIIVKFREKLFSYGDYNFIKLDWTEYCGGTFPQAIANGRVVGAQLAQLLQRLKSITKISLESVHLIGHSLGAHMVGWAGERLLNIGRITGLDPAGAYFQQAEDIVTLDVTDALFVDVIHTNGDTSSSLLFGGYGIYQPIGHLDFYPNGGQMQPGCNSSEAFQSGGPVVGEDCSHDRSLYLFFESIDNIDCKFISMACDSWEKYRNGECNGSYRRYRKELTVEMGFHATKHESITKSAMLFLSTKGTSPYCLQSYSY